MKLFKAIASVAITLILIWLLQTKFGSLPPIGKFLNPTTGFWQNAESKHIIKEQHLKLEGLQGKVTIRFDENRIPHIFAENDHDLYLAQGYITASDRLWSMDMQTRSAAGRLAEVVGPKALEIDRYHRRIGMVYGAEHTLTKMMQDPQVKAMVLAYTEGVNAYIHHLWKRDYPLEFKLLDYEPEDFKPINCALFLKLMSETLAGGSRDLPMTNDLVKFGPDAVKELFPDYPFAESPVIPAGTKWNFTPLAIPKPSDSFIAQMTDHKTPEPKEGIGSNNWVIAGSKSANGYPILANDPHLHLTLPSIWYQVQLSAPGINVNGVSFPGAPGVIIGYNQHVSWGVTNVDADVLDWYQIRFKDARKNEYWYNNKWNKVTRRIEEIKVRGHKAVYDTVLYTHQGPVAYEEAAKKPDGKFINVPIGHALRWIAHDASNEWRTFYLLDRAKNYSDYHEALKYFYAPAQNFVFASNDKDIAITINGRLPLKFREQGKFLLDGSDPANDWQGWIPFEQNPTAKNPSQGYLASANQSSTDPTYPYYINWRFGSYYRAKRINDRLARMQNATADSMRVLQMDDYSMQAHDVLPTMLKYIDASRLDADQKEVLNLLTNWDKHYAVNSIGASIYTKWWDEFFDTTWDEFADSKENLAVPTWDETTRLLLTDPKSKWFDIKRTRYIETCPDILNRTFIKVAEEMLHNYGKPGPHWEWGKVRKTFIDHLAGPSMLGFGTGNFEAAGSSIAVNAFRDDTGPSWRMVVQMGPTVKGYGIFPGGESGNPGSYYYMDMFNTWKEGRLNELLFLNSASEESPRITSTLTISK